MVCKHFPLLKLSFFLGLTPIWHQFFLFWCQKFTAILSSFAISFSILALSPKWLYTSIVTSKWACPIMYCNTLMSIRHSAILVQAVCRITWAETFGNQARHEASTDFPQGSVLTPRLRLLLSCISRRYYHGCLATGADREKRALFSTLSLIWYSFMPVSFYYLLPNFFLSLFIQAPKRFWQSNICFVICIYRICNTAITRGEC